MRTTNELPEAPMTTTTRTSRKDRKPPTRTPETAAEAALAATTDEVRPVVTLTPEAKARLEKERAKLEREQKAAARRQARIDALERGETLPAATSGLPPVVKMNELGALARQLHRAAELLDSDAVKALGDEYIDAARTHLNHRADDRGPTRHEAALTAARYRDRAISQWSGQFAQRVAAGAADNDTLHPLGLSVDAETGKVSLVEKKKPEVEKSEAA